MVSTGQGASAMISSREAEPGASPRLLAPTPGALFAERDALPVDRPPTLRAE